MDKISLGIPFFNSSEYIFDAIKTALNDDFISEIVICDDKSDQKHILNLYEIISNLSDCKKVKVVQNDNNLGPYRNKYRTVKNCKCDWVYLLDSDNYFDSNSLNVVKKLDYDLNTLYFPKISKVFPSGDNVEYNMFKKIDFHFVKNLVEKGLQITDSICMILNGGNFVVNKNEYIRTQQEFFNNYEDVFAADVIAFSYYWLKGGNNYEVVDNFEYYHRKRPDSVYITQLYESMGITQIWMQKYLQN